ncbi:F-box protein At3g07870-like [Bidens hawaiensis]|uniref:F-box protein At3g07870-like n=1 Tax=Bidens hawaiensis TaxID=980011 RepID=UPI00404A3F90
MADNNRSLIDFPKVYLERIFSNLPLPSLHVCCSVSKSLFDLIKRDSDFARANLAKSEPQLMIQSETGSSIHMVDLDTTDTASQVEVKPSFSIPLNGFGVAHLCNGLLLLESLNMDNGVYSLMLFNPVAGDYTLLPDSETLYKSGISILFYCPKTQHFEVVSAFHCLVPVSDSDSDSCTDPSSDSDSGSVTELNVVSDDTNCKDPGSDSECITAIAMGELYVKGSDSWQSLGNLPFSPLTIYSPCHWDKAMHWICADEAISNIIVFFNFETHKFGEIQGPARLGKTHAHAYNGLILLVLGGRLSIFDRFSSETSLDVWVRKEHGVRDSWTREYVIDTTVWGVYDLHRPFTPIICRNNGEVVMVSADGYMLFYDLAMKKGRIIFHRPINGAWRVVMHTPSFISLSHVVSDCNLKVVNVRSRFADPELNRFNYLQLAALFSD